MSDNDFEKYIKELADHEDGKSQRVLGPRERILVNAGIRLNWIGDYLANPDIEFKKKEIPLRKIRFTGTLPEWNAILKDRCESRVEKFQQLMREDESLRQRFTREASFDKRPILLRGPFEDGYYKVFDGMHRFVGAALENRETVLAYVPVNEAEHLPVCEAHTIYDLIRGFQRNAKDEVGKEELYNALKLLARTYANTAELLQTRFNYSYIPDEEVQEIIQKVLESNARLHK